MKRKAPKKLSLSRETLRTVGGTLADAVAVPAGALSIRVCTRVISDCLSCTTPLDGCPDPTIVAV